MKRYFVRTLSLCLAVPCLVFAVNFIVDPFNLNGIVSLGLEKERVSYWMHYQLYKMIEFRNTPSPSIILGDSRSGRLKTGYFKKNGINDVYNFAYGGGTLREEIDTFWYASSLIKLKLLIMGIPFNLFNERSFEKANLVAEARTLIDNPLSFYLNQFVLKASAMNIYYKLTGRGARDETPPMGRDAFWSRQLSANGIGLFYGRYRYPATLLRELHEIATYCREQGIRLIFFIPPTHTDLQDKVAEYGLASEHEQYLKDLSAMAELVDFNYSNRITRDRANFRDPYHFDDAIAEKIVTELVQGTSTFSRRYHPPEGSRSAEL